MAQTYCTRCDRWHDPEDHCDSGEGISSTASTTFGEALKNKNKTKSSNGCKTMDEGFKSKLCMWITGFLAVVFLLAAIGPHVGWYKHVGPVTDQGAKIDALGAKLDSVQKSVNDKNHNEIMGALHKLEDQGKMPPAASGGYDSREELVAKICKETGCSEAEAYRQLGSLEHSARVATDNNLRDTSAKLSEVQAAQSNDSAESSKP